MGLLTFPEALRRVGKPRSWGERVLWQYRDVLPPAQRLGSARVYPESIVERLQAIARQESEARR